MPSLDIPIVFEIIKDNPYSNNVSDEQLTGLFVGESIVLKEHELTDDLELISRQTDRVDTVINALELRGLYESVKDSIDIYKQTQQAREYFDSVKQEIGLLKDDETAFDRVEELKMSIALQIISNHLLEYDLRLEMFEYLQSDKHKEDNHDELDSVPNFLLEMM